MTSTATPQVKQLARRAALMATAFVAAVYLAISVAIVAWLTLSLTAQVDERLARALAFEARAGSETAPTLPRPPAQLPPIPEGAELADLLGEPPPGFPFGRERATWRIDVDGEVVSERSDLELPIEHATVVGPTTVTIDDTPIRIAGRDIEAGRLVVGESMAPVDDATWTVIMGLLIIAPFLLLAVFLGALTVGRRVATPVERARQRQLAFTADASHELRTPLSVIEANASLALATEREAAWYRRSFERVLAEAQRMHRLIDDLLWLARFDATQQPPAGEPVDLGVMVEQAADRFAALAETRAQRIDVEIDDPDTSLSAPPEWIDQLIAVLLDNACKYSPEGGRIVVRVAKNAGRVVLSVDDSGPGISDDEMESLFDRFHRGTHDSSGAGLGLAIGDAIVRATSGRWDIRRSELGGAHLTVSWPGPGQPAPGPR